MSVVEAGAEKMTGAAAGAVGMEGTARNLAGAEVVTTAEVSGAVGTVREEDKPAEEDERVSGTAAEKLSALACPGAHAYS